MFFGVVLTFFDGGIFGVVSRPVSSCALPLAIFCVLAVGGDAVASESKHIIGATATLMETKSGLSFQARIDTGAQSCSLHVEKIVIKDEAKSRVRNVGKTARVLLKDVDGKTEWIETKIVEAVRVKSSSLKTGEFDRRYKVRLNLKWKDFEKTVLVTLNDRTAMEFPLLVGRNYLRGDFLVDVEKKQ
jgi:hypothetical protein